MQGHTVSCSSEIGGVVWSRLAPCGQCPGLAWSPTLVRERLGDGLTESLMWVGKRGKLHWVTHDLPVPIGLVVSTSGDILRRVRLGGDESNQVMERLCAASDD